MVHLSPGESTRVPLNVKATTAVEAGRPARILVQARPAAYALWLRGTTIEAATHEVETPSPRASPRILTPPTKPVFRGDVAKISDIEGIGPTYAGQLEGIGIADTEQLLAVSPADVSQKTGIPEALILTWQAMADLIRIKGIGKQYAELLARAGITGVPQLAQESPESIVKQVEDYLATVERPPTHGRVVESRAKTWIEAAQDLEAEGAHFSKMMARGRQPARATH
jgi:predicted flap endonuclease-1-like 5' DNA nuclease